MLTRREVEGELRSLSFRAAARQRRAEREKAKRFAQCVLGAVFGVTLLAMLGFVNLLQTLPGEVATGRSGNGVGNEWVSGGSQSRRASSSSSLFFTGRRTRHPDDPRNRGRHRDD
jgi:hypothetical protein